MSVEFSDKNAKSPLQTSAMAHRRGHGKGVETKILCFVGHSVSTQRKIFLIYLWITLIDHIDMSVLSDYLYDMIYSVQLQVRYLFTKKLHECRNKLFVNSPVMLTSRTFRGTIYNVKFSAVAESHER